MRIIFDTNDSKILENSYDKSKVILNLTSEIPVENINIISCNIPYSFYNVNKYNNIIFIEYLTLNETIEIPFGNYNAYELISTFETLIKTFVGDAKCSYNKILNKFVFISSSSTYIIKFHYGQTYKLFGFNKSQEVTITPSEQEISTNVVQMNYTNYIFVRSNITNSNIFYNNNYTNFLCAIPVNGTPGQIIRFKNDNSDFSYSIHKNISYIEFELLDEYLNPIDLNGGDWNMEISI